jgi:hypothetical protein
MHNQQHPEPDQLDRLRAGLLDDQPAIKTALEAHIAGCTACQERCNWQVLHPGALGPDLENHTLRQSLRNARRQALQSGSQPRSYRFIPFASAALLLVAVSIGIWTLQQDHGEQQQIAAQDTGTVPDVYEDLDFYLWLANQEDNGSTDEDPDPDKT